MMNTWGMYSVNHNTFNNGRFSTGLPHAQGVVSNTTYPKFVRDKVYTALKVHNLAFNVLGYLSTRVYSGLARICSGAALIATTLAAGDRHGSRGLIIGRFYDEAIQTGIAQIVRGAFESFVPYGFFINIALDVVATPLNLVGGFEALSHMGHCCGCFQCDTHSVAMEDPTYPSFFKPLQLV